MCGVDGSRVCEIYVESTTQVDVYLIGYTTEGFVFFDNAVGKSLSATASWTDIDCSAVAPAAVGLMFDVFSASALEFGLRKNGSTDDRHFDAVLHSCMTALIGCDDAQIVEGYIEGTNADFYLLGYITSAAEITFNTNATDLSTATTGEWTDLATLPAGATGAIVEVTASSVLSFGLRENGSAEDIYRDAYNHPWAFVECDANRIIEGKIESTGVDFFLVGYTTAGAAPDELTAAVLDVPIAFGAAGLEVDLAATPLGIPIDFGAAGLAEALVGTPLDIPLAFGVAALEVGLTATALDVPVAFGAAVLGDFDVLTATPLDVPLAYGAASLTVELTATPLAVPVAFGAVSLSAALTATALAIPLAFDTATLVATEDLTATELDVPLTFGGAQLREIRTGEHVEPLALQEPLELRDSAGVLIRPLPFAQTVRVRQKINSLDVLSFEYPRLDSAFDDFEQGCLVRWRGTDYRVVDVDDARDSGSPTGSVLAEQWFIALGDTLVKEVDLESVTARSAMTTVLSGTGWSVGAVGPTGAYAMSDRWRSPLALLMQIADVWNGELFFDTSDQTVSLLSERGVDLGASLIYRKNIEGLSRKRSAGKLYNRVYFEGKDGLTSLTGYVQDARSIAAHGRRDYFWGDSSITTLATLIYGATLRLNAYKEPRTDYDASAFNFEPLVGGSAWVTAELGDTVRVYDEDLGINITTRVYEREWAPFEPDVPDRLKLSSDREWFPDLSERLAEVLEPEKPEEKMKPTPGEDACQGEGGYAWMDAKGVPAEWQGSGRPHIWTSYWAEGEAGLPHLESDGLWHSGYDTDGDGVQDSGPLGTGATWETATWEPHGFDLDCDGIEDFWPFSSGVDPETRSPQLGQPGGHCYDFDDVPETWDYAGGDGPYKAVDNIPAGLWYDVSSYSWYGYDRNQNGVPDSFDVIANLPCPLTFTRGELLLGFDLGGGNVRWDEANPPIIPMWHSPARADVQGIYCTGWTTNGQRNFSGPTRDADGSWTPDPYDTNDDGYADFWAYGGWWSFGFEVTEEGVSDQAVGVAACGAMPTVMGPVAPDLPTEAECVSTTLAITISADGLFYSSWWTHGYDTTIEDIQFVVTPWLYDDTVVKLSDISVERSVDGASVRIVGRADVV